LIILALVAAAAPAWADKEVDRLQVQILNLQGQVAELQRINEETLKELRRLNELLADQGLTFKRALGEQKAQNEAMLSGLKELSDRFADLGSRVQAAASGLPASTPTAAGDASPPGSGTAAPPAPKELYSQAYADYARGNYDLAIQEFQEFLKHYPNTDISDNAQYWVGKCLYGKQKFSDAVEAWNILLRDFPASDKLPDARVDKGLALEKLGRRSQALQEYRYVVDRYPNSPAARVARDKLNPQ
jgi:tol-pal system protein YbgF